MSSAAQDPLLDLVSRLPSATPSRVATERIRGRAHALLAAGRAPVATRRRLAASLTDLALAAVGVGYLLGAVGEALRLETFFR